MFGEIRYQPKGDGYPRRRERYGLPVLEITIRPGGWRERGRVRMAAKRLARQGVRRVLVPPEFDRWDLLESRGLQKVDPVPFLRFYAGELAVAALKREGLLPQQGNVALRGRQVDRDMVRAAEYLCPRVRELSISAQQGGEELAAWLRREYGMPVQPDGEGAAVVIRFDTSAASGGRRVLSLFGEEPELGEICPRASALAERDQKKISLLSALWETGKLDRQTLEFT